MNYKVLIRTLGNVLILGGCLLFLPLLVSLIYQEGTYYSYYLPALISIGLGFATKIIKKSDTGKMTPREAFVITGLSWILVSLIGTIPFVLRHEATFIDGLFETVSGFTTTGASALANVETCSNGILFWRSLTHWVGGMGVLVFILAILPTSEAQTIFLLKAESPGPQVGKLVSKVKNTTRILYLMYTGLTLLEMIFLLCGGMNFFDALCNSLATAGTGGFGLYSDSIAHYSIYSQIVIMVFMLLFGINFNIYYLLFLGHIKDALKSEELHWYLAIIFVAITIITTDIMLAENLQYTFGLALKDASFQVVAIITTTGFATTDFNLWPNLSRCVLVVLMFIGASAGSTGGGLKVARLVLLLKTAFRNLKQLVHHNTVEHVQFEGQVVDENTLNGVNSYFAILMLITCVSTVLVSINGFDLTTTFTATVSCMNNIGPGLNLVGPMGSYHDFSILSKLVLIFDMLVGRLEIYPILMLFSPKIWSKH